MKVDLFTAIKRIAFLYILKINLFLEDRFYWFALDPMNLSEALFALAILLTFARLCFWIPINQNLGPLQITLGAMISVYLNISINIRIL